MIVLYDYDSNAILVEPLRDRTGPNLQQGIQKCYEQLDHCGLSPKLHILDGEISDAVKAYLRKKGTQFQLTPPGMHRINAAERAIRTWKNHFISGLCTVDPKFPLTQWPELIPQGVITLNIVRPCRVNPSLSAYHYVWGAYDFNKTPLAPPGTKIVAHNKLDRRGSWAPHGEEGWYVGPAMDHYRCWRCYIPSTNGYRVSDTVRFFPATPVPTITPADTVRRAAKELTRALQNPTAFIPHPNSNDAALDAFRNTFQLAVSILKDKEKHTATPTPQKNGFSVPARAPLPGVDKAPNNHTTQVTTHRKVAVAAPIPGVTDRPESAILQALRKTKSGVAAAVIQDTDNVACFPQRLHPSYASAVIADDGSALEYRHLIADPETKEEWTKSAANEFGRLAQGIRDIDGTDTIFFIDPSKIPQGRTATYARFVCDIRPHKAEKTRTRITVGGNLISYPGSVTSKTADLITTKLLWNSVLSTPNAKYMTMDIKNYYLNTPLDRYEYIRFPLALIPEEIIDAYNLRDIARNGVVHAEIRKGMYGLPQAGMLANKLLQKRLAKHGYKPTKHTAGLWTHEWKPITFTLVVDDFGVKYVGKEHAEHLYQTLQQYYETSCDWNGELYCGITLKWDYTKRTVDLTMPGYVQSALHKYQHGKPSRQQHSPYPAETPHYGAKVQLTPPTDKTRPMTQEAKRRLQQIVGTFLYYARAVDATMLMALSTLGSEQTTGTEKTERALLQFLNYCATHPDATIRYKASDMVLLIDSDASYLSESEARSRAGGYFYLGSDLHKPQRLNGAIHILATIIKNVMSSAAEAEVGAAFTNAKEAIPMRTALEEMGHPQPPTPLQTDNSTAHGIINDTVKQRRSKAIDMRFYWLRDRTLEQKQFQVYWKPGKGNLADYVTKHHPASHHINMRPYYIHGPKSPTYLPSSLGHGDTKSITTVKTTELQRKHTSGCCRGVLGDFSSSLALPGHPQTFPDIPLFPQNLTSIGGLAGEHRPCQQQRQSRQQGQQPLPIPFDHSHNLSYY